MSEIDVVCTHDAVKFSETLGRVLESDKHRVRIHFGRHSLMAMNEVKRCTSAVLIVWSPDAPAQAYMHEWARNTDPARRVEIASALGAPRHIERTGAVIDFMQWRGEHGGRAWNALRERLQEVDRALFPQSGPPKQALMAVGLASIAAVGGAFMVRVNANDTLPLESEPLVAQAAAPLLDPNDGLGGAMEAIEPPSAEDIETLRLTPIMRQTLDLPPAADLHQATLGDLPELRDPTLMERISDLNPLRRR